MSQGGRFLIDLTDERFKTPQNAAVILFIDRVNPFAHSDVGDRLLDSARQLLGVRDYCPAPANCAYLVLHTAANRIFAIAYGQRGLAYRLPRKDISEAMADGGT